MQLKNSLMQVKIYEIGLWLQKLFYLVAARPVSGGSAHDSAHSVIVANQQKGGKISEKANWSKLNFTSGRQIAAPPRAIRCCHLAARSEIKLAPLPAFGCCQSDLLLPFC